MGGAEPAQVEGSTGTRPTAATSRHFTIPGIRWHSGPRGNQEPKRLSGLGQLNLLHGQGSRKPRAGPRTPGIPLQDPGVSL